MERKHIYLAMIFLASFSVRMVFELSTTHYSDDQSYFTLRQAEAIKKTGIPLFEDPYSYGGRHYVFLPSFHYILSLGAREIILNLFACTIVIFVFKIVELMTQSEKLSLFSAILGGFVPIFFSRTVNNLSIYSITVPLTFLAIYHFLRIGVTKKPLWYLASFIILTALSPISIFLVITMVVYLVFSTVMRIDVAKEQKEIVYFSVPFVIWLYFLVFKKAIQMHGLLIIHQNLPDILLENFFKEISLMDAVYNVGVIPIFAGIASIYMFFLKKKGKAMAFFVAMAITISGLLYLKLIRLDLGLIYIGVVLVILSSVSFKEWADYLKRTRFAISGRALILMFFLVFSLTSILPSLVFSGMNLDKTISSRDTAILTFFRNMTESNDTILTTINEGHIVSYYSQRRNVIDSNFLYTTDLDIRIKDVKTMYTATVSPMNLFRKYKVDYIYLSDDARRMYNISKITYVDHECFIPRFSDRLIEVRCK